MSLSTSFTSDVMMLPPPARVRQQCGFSNSPTPHRLSLFLFSKESQPSGDGVSMALFSTYSRRTFNESFVGKAYLRDRTGRPELGKVPPIGRSPLSCHNIFHAATTASSSAQRIFSVHKIRVRPVKVQCTISQQCWVVMSTLNLQSWYFG